jgi:NAD(P)-dependent dehydrogenase (short-subunit alcohol dehydrogenase family)
MRQMADRLAEHGCLTLVAHRSVYEAMDRLDDLREEEADPELIADAEADLEDCRTAWAWADIIQLAYRDAYLCLGDVFDENTAIAVKYDVFKEALAAWEQEISTHPEDYAPWELGEVRKWMASVNANPNVLTQKQSPTFNLEKYHGV